MLQNDHDPLAWGQQKLVVRKCGMINPSTDRFKQDRWNWILENEKREYLSHRLDRFKNNCWSL